MDKPTTSRRIILTLGSLYLPGLAYADQAADYRLGAYGSEDFGVQSSFEDTSDVTQRAEMLFKLTPSNVEASVESASVRDNDRHWRGQLSFSRIDFLKPGEARMQDIHQGFSYTASVDVEKTDDFESDSRLISSRQLGIHYGRLGSVNYSGIDLSIRQFNDKEQELDPTADDQELWSLGVTTGRRFAMTGLDASDPIWTVSLRGRFNFVEMTDKRIELGDHQWFLSPGLHWQSDSFRLSADVLMPFLQSGEYEEETDYRVRANIQKRF